MTDAAKAIFKICLKRIQLLISNLLLYKVSWPDSGIYVPAENYSAEVEVENNLVYLLSTRHQVTLCPAV